MNQIDLWKSQKLIESLKNVHGNHTSMISLIIPPKDSISKNVHMLEVEYGTASNIKSRVNRLSVLSAIVSVQQKLKLYPKVPPNGLVIYCGTMITDEGKEKKINIDFEPIKPVNTSLYLCDNRFHTEMLEEMIKDSNIYGFIVMDGKQTLFATLQGNVKRTLHHFSVDLPNKQRKGGQSSVRFSRLRVEARNNYVRKVCEETTRQYITNDIPNVKALFIGGSADFKTELTKSDLFDPRLTPIIAKICDISYGGENGLNQLIDQCQDMISSARYIDEKRIITEYFNEIYTESNKYCYGAEKTIEMIKAGVVNKLIVYEKFDEETLNWIVENYKTYNIELYIITDNTEQATQFIRTFGAIGAILHYPIDQEIYEEE